MFALVYQCFSIAVVLVCFFGHVPVLALGKCVGFDTRDATSLMAKGHEKGHGTEATYPETLMNYLRFQQLVASWGARYAPRQIDRC